MERAHECVCVDHVTYPGISGGVKEPISKAHKYIGDQDYWEWRPDGHHQEWDEVAQRTYDCDPSLPKGHMDLVHGGCCQHIAHKRGHEDQ